MCFVFFNINVGEIINLNLFLQDPEADFFFLISWFDIGYRDLESSFFLKSHAWWHRGFNPFQADPFILEM